MVDEVYDKTPSHLTVKQAHQKWGILRFDIDKEDQQFEAFYKDNCIIIDLKDEDYKQLIIEVENPLDTIKYLSTEN